MTDTPPPESPREPDGPPEDDATAPAGGRWPLHTQILVALVGGAAAAVLVRSVATWLGVADVDVATFSDRWVAPFGDLFMQAMLVSVVPLVFCSIVIGVYRLGDLGALGRLGARTLLIFVLTSACAAVIATLLVTAVRPGDYVSPETRAALAERFAQKVASASADADAAAARMSASVLQLIVGFVPDNIVASASSNRRLLEVIAAALLFGAAMLQLPAARVRALAQTLEAAGDTLVAVIGIVMRLAPIGVFALVFSVVARFGVDVLGALAVYTAVALAALALHLALVLVPLVSLGAGVAPIRYLRAVREIALAAFSTASSNATLPTTLRVVQRELDVPRPIASFVLPLGATVNMDGTAAYQIVAVHFVAQVWGIPMPVSASATLIVVAMLTAIGAAGVPGGVIPLLFVAMASAQIPDAVIPLGIGLVLGVDRLIDMCRTTVNVLGDAATATVVARIERGRAGTPQPEPVT